MKRSTLLFLVFVSLVLVTGLVLYTRMGGFNEPVINVVEAPGRIIKGEYYEGKVRDKALAVVFEHYTEEAKSGHGYLAAAYYNDPEKDNGVIKAFIGILQEGEMDRNIQDSSSRVFSPRTVIEARLKANYLLAPVKIYNKVQAYAKDKGLLLDDFSIEIYPSDQELIVEVPIKQE